MSLDSRIAPGGRKIGLSRVAELTFDVLKRDFGLDYAVAVGVAVIPMLLKVLLVQGQVRSVQGGGAVHLNAFGAGFIVISLLSLLSLIATVLIYAAIAFGAVERLQGRAASLGQRMTAALRAAPVLVGVALVAYIALVIATILLVVPALFLGVCWSVVVPVVAVERLGVFETFGRSFELTRNNRWSIFLLLLVFWVVSLLVTVLGALLVRAIFGVTGGLFALTPAVGPTVWASFGVSLLISAAVNTVGATGVGVVYSELRGVQGGFDARRLSEVFA